MTLLMVSEEISWLSSSPEMNNLYLVINSFTVFMVSF